MASSGVMIPINLLIWIYTSNVVLSQPIETEQLLTQNKEKDDIDVIIIHESENPDYLQLIKMLLANQTRKTSKRNANFNFGNAIFLGETDDFDISKYGRGNDIGINDQPDRTTFISNSKDGGVSKYILRDDNVGTHDEEFRLRDNLRGLVFNQVQNENVRGHDVNTIQYRDDDDASGHDYDDSIFRRGRIPVGSDGGRRSPDMYENVYSKQILEKFQQRSKKISPETIRDIVNIKEGMVFREIFEAFNAERKMRILDDKKEQNSIEIVTHNNVEDYVPVYTQTAKRRNYDKRIYGKQLPNDINLVVPDADGNYFFRYKVEDAESGNNYGHTESREGSEVRGFVHVYYPLDDGLLTINYTLGSSEFMAKYMRPVNEVPGDA